MDLTTTKYQEDLKIYLSDREEAAAYLNAALEENDQEVFLLALRDLAQARGYTSLAEATNLNRENLYRMMSAGGNPQLTSLSALLGEFGLRLAVEVV